MRTLSLALLLAPALGCGPPPELVRYRIDIAIEGVPDWLTPAAAGAYYEVAPCANAEVFDQTLRVYDGAVPDAVTAIRFTWTGFDLSGGGENTETIFLREGQTYTVVAALDPSIALYEVDDRGRMLQLDRKVAKVRRKREAEADYVLGEGLPITEVHALDEERDEVRFVEEGAWNCELTQF